MYANILLASSGLPPWEAPVMIAEKYKLFFSFLLLANKWLRHADMSNANDSSLLYACLTNLAAVGGPRAES